MQIHERSLIADGLSVVFKRLRDEKPMKAITGTLKRVN